MTNEALTQILNADEQIDDLTADEVKDVYVRVRLAREASGEYSTEEIVDWVTDSDEYLGTFANKLGLDVDTWGGDIIDQLWDLCTTDVHNEEKKVEGVRQKLQRNATNEVGTAASKVQAAVL